MVKSDDVLWEQFDALPAPTSAPNASMFFVAVWTGLRVTELIGLKCQDMGADSLIIVVSTGRRFGRSESGSF